MIFRRQPPDEGRDTRGQTNGEEEKPVLEKGDLSAMLIASIMVYGPFLLAFIGVTLLLTWLFGGFR